MQRLWRGWRRLRLIETLEQAAARRRVLLIAPYSSYRIAPYVEAAQRLGIELRIVSEGRHSLVAAVADGIHVDFSDPDTALTRILEAVAERPVDGVIGCDDATVELAARVAGRLGLVCNPPMASRISRRKDLARQCLASAGIPVPGFQLVHPAQDPVACCRGLSYPMVAKPVSLSGSRGVIRVDDPQQLRAACARIRAILDRERHLSAEERNLILVETFVPGPEVAVEGMLHDGEFTLLAMFDKPDPLDGPFFEETIYTTPSRLSAAVQAQIIRRVAEVCAAYGLREGPVHAELRWHDGDAWVMELASRTIGGECARLLRYGSGRSLEELVLAHACRISLPPLPAAGGAGVMMLPIRKAGILRRVEGLLAARRVPGIEEIEISVREGYELVPLPEGSSYLGFMFAVADDAAAAEQALREAYAHLRVVTAEVLFSSSAGGSSG